MLQKKKKLGCFSKAWEKHEHARNSCTFETDLSIRTHLHRSETNYCFIMPPKSSAKSSTASSVPKSPPKAHRSSRKCTQSSTSAAADSEPPAKKIAPSGEGEEGEGPPAPKPGRGKARRGKAIRCVTPMNL